ncbi:hypothetical protein AK830_g6370 [Neonectria ditissima]|uniref:Uncharacterized protein n=1 Tax=Neonectria ditissima TaxID=78410 RepID=A0A0P7BJG9_9HYPO|nr:hypothetical protein AK830_g6370 [Neonectria ditissima]
MTSTVRYVVPPPDLSGCPLPGRRSTQPADLSRNSQVLPLLIVLAILAVGGWVGYQVYLSVAKIQETASERMGKKNVVFTKDGLRVGVKQMENENYVDATQSWVVKAWNLGTASNDAPGSKKDSKKKK